MIAREWKCKCPNTSKENFIEYLYKTGVNEASKTPGFLGVQIFSRDVQEKTEITPNNPELNVVLPLEPPVEVPPWLK